MKLISMRKFVAAQMSDKNYHNTMQEKGTDNIEGFILGHYLQILFKSMLVVKLQEPLLGVMLYQAMLE